MIGRADDATAFVGQVREGKKLTDSEEFQALLAQNRSILARHAERHDLSGLREIDIGSHYGDRDTAMAARKYVKERYRVPQGILFRVVSHKYAEGDVTIDLMFSLEEVPDAESITRYEFMLLDAAAKFGGDTPGWEIALKPV
jgi:hypothetical protein